MLSVTGINLTAASASANFSPWGGISHVRKGAVIFVGNSSNSLASTGEVDFSDFANGSFIHNGTFPEGASRNPLLCNGCINVGF